MNLDQHAFCKRDSERSRAAIEAYRKENDLLRDDLRYRNDLAYIMSLLAEALMPYIKEEIENVCQELCRTEEG